MQQEPEDPWAGYGRTEVEIETAGVCLVVRPAPSGQVDRWPFESAQAVYVLTAWDPGDKRPGDEANRRQQAALESDLRRLAAQTWAASGVEPVSGHREEGVAVRGLSEGEVLALGARYGQDAVFVWTPGSWDVVACAGGRRESSGWHLGGRGGRTSCGPV